MRKRFNFILILILLFSARIVYADSNVDFICPNEAMVGNTITCKVKINSDTKILGILAHYNYDSNLTFSKETIDSDSLEIVDNSEGFTIVNTNGLDTTNAIQQFNLIISNKAKPGNTYDVKLTGIQLSDGEKDINIEDKTSTIKILSIKDIIESLKINNQDLEIKDGITDYTITVNNEVANTEIISKFTNEKYHLTEESSPTKVENLKVGDNIIKLEIANDDLTLITYTINIKRLEPQKESQKGIEQLSKKEEITNPQTGQSSIIIISLILIAVTIIIILIQKRTKGSAN